jgi:hypothetical protein
MELNINMDNNEYKQKYQKQLFFGNIMGGKEDDNEYENEEGEQQKQESEGEEESSYSENRTINSIILELGDIIEIVSPTNPELNNTTSIITYIDSEKIKLLNVANYHLHQLNITENGRFSDESITEINLLNRSSEKGYARQNNLLPTTWVDIYFGGEIPMIITGEITNLEEDMIEITTYPEVKTIYINFEYQGIPENIPLEKIVIRQKPESLDTNIQEKRMERMPESSEIETGIDADIVLPEKDESLASIVYTEVGESIIQIPDSAVPDENIRETLNDLYIDANSIIFGPRLGEITQYIEVPDSEKRYTIDIQVNDFMDELLSTIPNYQRTPIVMDNISRIIDRFKELRSHYSKFDNNSNVYDYRTVGAYYKPIIEHITNLDQKLQWVLPVVSNRRNIYNVQSNSEDSDEIPEDDNTIDVIYNNSESSIIEIYNLQNDYYKNKLQDQIMYYNNIQRRIYELLKSYQPPINKKGFLLNTNVMTNMDTIIDNLDDFYSHAIHIDNPNKKIEKMYIEKKQYVIQHFTTGLSKPQQNTTKTGTYQYNMLEVVPNDEMTMKSIILLPESVVRFSKVGLPMTNILKKSEIHANYLLLFRLFRKKTNITSHVIDDLNKEIDYETMEKDKQISFLNGIHEFSLDPDLNRELNNINGENDDEKMKKFLEVVIPKTRYLIKKSLPYIKDKLSLVNIVEELEPFLVYNQDITYKQYLEIRHIIKERIKDIKIQFQKKSSEYSLVRNAKYNVQNKQNTILQLMTEKQEFIDQLFLAYKVLNKDKQRIQSGQVSAQELITEIINVDYGNIYTNMISSLLLSLMTPTSLIEVLSKPKIVDMTELEKIKPSDCSIRYLAKKYTSIRELQKDNNSEDVFYDEDFDDTPYSILKKYEKQQKSMSPKLFFEFLSENLIQKHECPEDAVINLTTTLISKKKKVIDGNYAILEIRPTLMKNTDESKLSDKEKIAIQTESDIRKKTEYYVRRKNNWIRDDSIDTEAFIDNNKLFCNISATCFKNTENNVCETVNDTSIRMKEIAKKKMLNEFDKRYEINIEEIEKELNYKFEMFLKNAKKIQLIKEIELYKTNNLQFELGRFATNTDDILQSPFLKLRDLIFGQEDFTKKQYDICRFVDNFCREPMVAELEENANWLYCRETNTKLIPNSLYQLSLAFVLGGNDGVQYSKRLDDLCHSVGILSNDGDSIVDKHSGYVLRKIDFSSEEGFDEAGFRIDTHAIMEKDVGTVIAEAIQKNKKPVFENETSEIIYNVFSTICFNIDIPSEKILDFVMHTSEMLIHKNILKEDVYEKRSAKQEKEKGKRLQPYLKYRNETMIFIIASVVLIAIQTATPSFQTKKTFPGCIRSFSGFPSDGGVEDMTGIKYIACVLNKTKDSIPPWDAIKKYNIEVIMKRMKDIIENYIMKISHISELYTIKREYLLLNPESSTPQEHSISKWYHFLPPVIQFKITNSMTTVSNDFKTELLDVLRKGDARQFKMVHVLKGKILRYGYGIIEYINRIVASKTLILKTMSDIPFIENACCNETDMTNPKTYFNETENDKNIGMFSKIVEKITQVLKDVESLSTAALLYDPRMSGMKYPEISTGISEDTIYQTIIHYCNFDRELPIPTDFESIISSKIPQYNRKWSMSEKIEFFKRNGKRYTIDTLHQIMKIVFTNNLVVVENPIKMTQIDIFKDVLDKLNTENSIVFEEILREKINKVLDKYDPKKMIDTNFVSIDLENLKKYLEFTNKKMLDKIMDFFNRYGNLSNRNYSKFGNFLDNIIKYENTTGSQQIRNTQFIENIIYFISKVYPNSLMTKNYFYSRVPDHWELSSAHTSDIINYIKKYYENIEKFRSDNVLMELFKEIDLRLNDVYLFVKNIPIYSEITKIIDDPEEGKKQHHFYSLFDKDTINGLYKYCIFSSIYEYIVATDDIDLLRADVQELKNNRRNRITEDINESNILRTIPIDTRENDDLTENDNELQEYQINIGNTQELKERVCSLLLVILDVEIENKDVVLNLTYEQIKSKVDRSKEKEKRGIIRNLGNMADEERVVENMLKNLRIGRWNVGQQKGLFQYDKDTYDREMKEKVMADLEDIEIETNEENATMEFGNPNIALGVEDLENQEELEAQEEEERDIYILRQAGENYMDGVYYDEDRDDEDFQDD